MGTFFGSHRPSPRRRRKDFRPHSQSLEGRLLLAIFTVTRTADDRAEGSLRWAIGQANANFASTPENPDTIRFEILESDPGYDPSTGTWTIMPSLGINQDPAIRRLETIERPVIIDGYTQPGALKASPFNNAVLKIVINGSLASTNASGLRIFGAAHGTQVSGLVINGFGADGIFAGADNLKFQGNFIGTDETGRVPVGNRGAGINLSNNSNCTIGGTILFDGNIISGNGGFGVFISSTGRFQGSLGGHKVQGNYIGTDIDVGNSVGNGDSGVVVQGSPGNIIGGMTENERNVISGNGKNGIEVRTSSERNVIQNNYIGTDYFGNYDVSNRASGIAIFSSAYNSVIGNLVSGNTDGLNITGVGTRDNIVQGNFFGTNSSGTVSLSGTQVSGVILGFGASNNLLGGTTPGARNVISGHANNGVIIQGTNNLVQGNFIGTDVTGLKAIPNFGNGVLIVEVPSATRDNVIGGTTAAARNIISGNLANGVNTGGPNSVVQGNYIGTDLTGKSVLPNGSNGILVRQGADGSTVGGTTAAARNIISGNQSHGVVSGAKNTVVQGNFIGTDVDGKTALGNSSNGVLILPGVDGSLIGGLTPGARNIISGNQGNGVVSGAKNTVVQGNFIGTDVDGKTALGNSSDGVLILSGADGSTIGGPTTAGRNIISGNFNNGIASDANQMIVQNNFIGTNVNGDRALNNFGIGVRISDSINVTIGGTDAGNTISNNRTGVSIAGGSNISILGNSILGNNGIGVTITSATDITIGGPSATNNILGNGTGVAIADGARIPIRNNKIRDNNGIGVTITGSTEIVIGGTTADFSNVIDCNGTGVAIAGGSGNPILGNSIQKNLGLGVSLFATNNNAIGGTGAGARNTIAGNNTGVAITRGDNNPIVGNTITDNMGIGVSIASGVSNRIVSNTIADNGLGIDLGPPGPTLNDLNDSDSGANGLQNFPVLTAITTSRDGTSTRIQGNFNSTASTNFNLQFFSDRDYPNRFGQGRILIDQRPVTTDANGNAVIDFTVPGAIARGDFPYVSATATNLATGDTSEFSPEITEILYTVTNTSDSGQGSLRQAILNANANPMQGARLIEFRIAGPGPYVIAPTAPLPAISEPVIIDATTQDLTSPTPLVELTGRGLPASGDPVNGLTINAGGITVKGLAIGSFSGGGIVLNTLGNNTIQGNYIGTDITGTQTRGNGLAGVIINNSSNNTIGGTTVAARNVISGNRGTGISIIFIGSQRNQVLGNYIGIDFRGLAALGNGSDGVRILSDASNNTIGGPTVAGRNVISGNTGNGVSIVAPNNVVQGNYIGTDVSGGSALGNGGDGVSIIATGTAIGGNLISGQARTVGVRIQLGSTETRVQGNVIGLDADGRVGLPNEVGVFISDSQKNTVGVGTDGGAGNVISGNRTAGVYISGLAASGNVVAGNIIGLDPGGRTPIVSSPDVRPATARDSRQDVGVLINGAGDNTIGGTTTAARNVISGNYVGVELATFSATQPTTGNRVLGNYIGLDVTGVVPQGNLFGVFINGLPGNMIGGPSPGDRNFISGNTQAGIDIRGGTTTGNRVWGNTIGPGSDGRFFMLPGNNNNNRRRRRSTTNPGIFVQPIGVGIQDAGSQGMPSNEIGGMAAGTGNLIAGNDQAGVYILGNPPNNQAVNNVVRGNQLVNNGLYGVLQFNAPNNTVAQGSAQGANSFARNGIAPVREFSGTRRRGTASNGARGPGQQTARTLSHPKAQSFSFRRAQQDRPGDVRP